VAHISEVNQRRARLVLAWVTTPANGSALPLARPRFADKYFKADTKTICDTVSFAKSTLDRIKTSDLFVRASDLPSRNVIIHSHCNLAKCFSEEPQRDARVCLFFLFFFFLKLALP